MTKLAELRRELTALAARRRRARLVDALLVGAALAAVGLGVYYRLDRRFTFHVGSRAFLDVVLLLGSLWFALRRILPVFRLSTDEIETALQFERRRGIDADVVAALQFDRQVAEGDFERLFGSTALATTVIDEVAETRREWDFSQEPIEAASPRKRLGLAAVSASLVVAALCFPRHSAVFLERLLLGAAHYPSNTQIDRLTVHGRDVGLSARPTEAERDAAIVVPLGRPLAVEMQTSGTPPDAVRLELMGEKGATAVLDLTPVGGEPTIFRGTLPGLVESVQGRAFAGDAYTDPFLLAASALPALIVTLEVTPPAYARTAPLEAPPPGRLHAAVLEGSRVALSAHSTNKSLTEVVLTHGEREFRFAREGDDRTWRLAATGTEFDAVARPIEFTIDAVDVNGFHLAEPLRGSLALRVDQPPTVAADVVTKYVLPIGKPSIFYQANDDLGISALRVERQVLRADGSSTVDQVEVPTGDSPQRTTLSGKFPMELAGLQLHKGDKVTVTMLALDRSERTPSRSEPFSLEVTDEQGLYAAMAETDQRSALKMDEIIQKQLLITGRTSGSSTVPPPKPAPSATAKPTGSGEK